MNASIKRLTEQLNALQPSNLVVLLICSLCEMTILAVINKRVKKAITTHLPIFQNHHW